jgi:hypothetical protein
MFKICRQRQDDGNISIEMELMILNLREFDFQLQQKIKSCFIDGALFGAFRFFRIKCHG